MGSYSPMGDMMIGVSALKGASDALIRKAGIGWVREDVPFPFAGAVGGPTTGAYRSAKEDIFRWAARGLKVLGVTPLPGIGTREKAADGTWTMKWTTWIPEWAGKPGSAEYMKTYEATCAFLAAEMRGKVAAWQIMNELDIAQFAGPLNPKQACDLITAAARGLKSADPSLVVGHNPAGAAEAYFFFGRLFGIPDRIVDYCGIDGYYGSWAEGGPEKWAGRIDELSRLTGAPILVNEWGFASRGGIQTEEDRKSGKPSCGFKKWPHTWGDGHTAETQARFVKECYEIFRTRKTDLLGAFFYRWEDQETCWQCGSPDCPCETAWGLVDLKGDPKPAYKTFQEGVHLLVS